MTSKQRKTVVFAAIPFLAVVGVVFDFFTPLGVADWVWYFIPLLLSVYVGGRSFPYVLAAVFSLLTFGGLLPSKPGIEFHLAFTSRLVGVCVQWLMAFLISQRKRVEGELTHSRQMLRLILDTIPQRVFWKDRDLKYLGCNRSFALDAGYSDPDELVGKSDFEASWKALADRYRADDQQVLDTGKPRINFDEPLVGRDGARSWLTTSKVPLLDSNGRVIGVLGIYEDITERKRTQETLATEQRLLENLITAIPDVVYFKDRGSRFTRVNAAFIAKHGLPDTGTARGKTDSDLFGEEHARQAYEDEQRIMAQGQPIIDREEKEDWKDGRVTWVSSTKMPLRDSTGKIVGIMGVSRDITERKRVEAELSRERDLWQTLLENSPDCIYFKDAESRFIKASQAQARLFGVKSPDEMVGKTDFDFFTEAHARPAFEDEQEIIRTGRPIIAKEECEVWNDGHVTWASSTKMPMRDDAGKIVGIMGISRDVTERKRAEQQLAETLDFNQKIILDAPAGILVYKASGQCVLANDSAARTLNATVPQLLNQNFRQLESWRVSGVLKTAEETLATGSARQCEPHFVSTFDREVWLACHFSPFVRGQESHLLVLFSDVTEKKKMETQFLRSQRMESLGTLAGGIAHDLNNVLAPLFLSIELLKEKITDADGLSLLERLNANVQRGANLVKQVLTFGRGVTGDRVTIQPRHIAREIRQIVGETFPKSIAFELHPDDGLWTIIGDPTQLQQILLNLCVNARDAMPNGGKLSIYMENILLDEACAGLHPEARPGPYVLIKVADTGTGIPKEIQDKIFDPFFTTKEPGKGTGLGLSTTLGIIKSHGGFINCYSEPDKGSIFKVYLPANTTPAGVEKLLAGEARLPRGHNELVLLVDDEEPVRELAQKVLERYGYRTLLAADGIEAVSLCRTHRSEIDVVVTDMAMPIMDGAATIAALEHFHQLCSVSGM